MRVVMVTQQANPHDPILGFTTRWIEEIAQRVESLDLITLSPAQFTPPANVRTFDMGKGSGRLTMATRYWQALVHSLPDADVLFCHMAPRYVWMGAPLAWRYRVPIVLWFTHPHLSHELRVAIPLTRAIATADITSFPLKHPKVRALGHGIDSGFFVPAPDSVRDDPPLIVQVGRLMPIKRQAILLKAVARLSVPYQVALIGGVPDGHNGEYARQVQALAEELNIAHRVTFTGALPKEEVLRWYQRASVAVNLTPTGSFDKAVLESLMCGVPTVTANSGFEPVMGRYAPQLRIVSPDDAETLAHRLEHLLTLPAQAQQEMGQALHAQTVRGHNLQNLADQLVALFGEVRR